METVKTNITRWTYYNKYIFDKIQELFGKNVKDRFFLMCTFSDGQKPLVIEVLEDKFLYEKYFCFNNSALYSQQNTNNANIKYFWKLGMDNLKNFLDLIITNNLPPVSLDLTKRVISIRISLFENVKDFQKRVNEGIKISEKYKELIETKKRYQKIIDENANFKVKQIIKIQRTIKLDKAYQFCINCSRMYCRNCEWPKNEHYSRCHHYNNGKCNGCPGHCDRYAH